MRLLPSQLKRRPPANPATLDRPPPARSQLTHRSFASPVLTHPLLRCPPLRSQLTHRSFASPKWLEYALALLGTCGLEMVRALGGRAGVVRDPAGPPWAAGTAAAQQAKPPANVVRA